MEEWRDIKGYEGYYQVSNMGNVRSLDRTVVRKDGVVQHRKGRPMKLTKESGGYYMVGLCKNGHTTHYKVHRLVLETFAPIENPQRFEVDHWDFDRTNNSLENLHWLAPIENNKKQQKARRVGQFDKDGLIGVFSNIREAERRTGIHHGSICHCCKGERKTAGGFIWKYYTDENDEQRR